MGAATIGLDGLAAVGLDSMCFIYHLEANLEYVIFTEAVFTRIEGGRLQAMTSVMSIADLLVRPLALGDTAAAADYRYWMEKFPNLSLAEVGVDTVVEAASLTAKHGLRLPDALQLASCLEADVDAFITDDKSLQGVKEQTVLLISDLAAQDEAPRQRPYQPHQ